MLNGLMMDDFQLSLTALVRAGGATELGAPRWCLVAPTAPFVARPSASAPSVLGGSRAGSPPSGSVTATGWRRCCGTRPSTSSCTSRSRSWER